MKQSLELKLGQHLAMTPQLQQAIRLLQLSTLELQQEVRSVLDRNPLLEEEEGGAAPGLEPAPTPPEETHGPETMLNLSADAPVPEELPVDSAWEDVFDIGVGGGSVAAPDEDLPELEARNSAPQTLHDHLLWQMRLTPFTDEDRAIALALIDAIDEDGYLRASLEEIAEMLEIEPESVTPVLKQIQHFDPPGVGARDLGECLLLQLAALEAEQPGWAAARAICAEHLHLLGRHDYTQLRAVLGIDEDTLRAAVRLICQLNPRPGEGLNERPSEYVVPDVVVRRQGRGWRVELNPEILPRLRINQHYARMGESGRDAAHKYIQEHLAEARWFIKSLQNRQETVLKVATAIVERQRAFFERGPEAMRPMVLRDIAEAVGMHESTISRVTNQKYMLTPRGLLEFKYFFSSHVSTDTGGVASATAIRALIGKFIAEESPLKPLSDSQLVDMLAAQGIQIARRTVAKYRESLNISPSSQRKRLT
ncbi:MAG: RNA polymerase factor sigma-54 [Pseudomonadota bacterium]